MRYVIYVVLLIATTSSHADTYNEPIAIFVSPTDIEIEKAQKSFTDEEYSNWVDHGTFYSRKIEEFLKGLGVKVISSTDMEFAFNANGKEYKLSLFNRDYQWSVIMFNGTNAPRLYVYPYDPDAIQYYANVSNN